VLSYFPGVPSVPGVKQLMIKHLRGWAKVFRGCSGVPIPTDLGTLEHLGKKPIPKVFRRRSFTRLALRAIEHFEHAEHLFLRGVKPRDL
jgi:hypothetical protein